MLGNALNPRAGTGNNAAGGLASMMTPQTMSAAQRLMGLGRRLQQWGAGRASQMAMNNMRAQAATSQVWIILHDVSAASCCLTTWMLPAAILCITYALQNVGRCRTSLCKPKFFMCVYMCVSPQAETSCT
jgi:hypothetical protein